jgi:hypothetical protein
MSIPPAIRTITLLFVAVVLFFCELPVVRGDDPPITDQERRAAAVALNYSRAALHRIRRNPSVRVMIEEQEKILNHLNLNGVADEEVMKLYSSVLDEISQIQIADRERDVLRDKYRVAFQRDLGLSALAIAAQVATTQYGAAVRTGASSWWDYRSLAQSKELDLWQIDKARLTSVVDKSTQFLDTSWKMARAKQIPDRWLVRNDDLDKVEQAWREPDPTVRLRVLKRMESFLECYPPYWYYVARTQQSLGQLFAASQTYEKLAKLGNGHFRKDEMLAAALANRAFIQSYLNQPEAADTAMLALEQSTEAWEANLICATVLQKSKRYQEAEDAILRNIDVNLERTQSRIALLGLYYESDNRPELAARLTDPDWVRDIPAPLLLRFAAKLAPATPLPVLDQMQSSLQGTPRFNFGRDDFVLTASPTWRLQEATVALHLGDRTFTNPRLTAGHDSMLVSFDGIAEFGGPNSSTLDNRDVSVTIKYPNAEPVTVTLSSGTATTSTGEGLAGLSLTGRSYPVYQIAVLEQKDVKFSLRGAHAASLTDVMVPVSRTTAKPVLDAEDHLDSNAAPPSIETPKAKSAAAANGR